MRRHLLYLKDILDSIDRIITYTKGVDYDSFLHNQMMIDAVVRNLEIIGEAAGQIPNDVKENHGKIPWKQMKGLRNILIHEYFGIDESIVWNIATVDLVKTREDLLKVIQEEGDVS